MSEIAYFEITYDDGRKEVKRVPAESLRIIEAVLGADEIKGAYMEPLVDDVVEYRITMKLMGER